MKSLAILTLALSLPAFADYGFIQCKGGAKTVSLNLDEMADISEESASLKIDGKKSKLSKISVRESDYGVLALKVHVGTGAKKFIFSFKNLGSASCFGVHGSGQSGKVTVGVQGAQGKVDELTCRCGQSR